MNIDNIINQIGKINVELNLSASDTEAVKTFDNIEIVTDNYILLVTLVVYHTHKYDQGDNEVPPIIYDIYNEIDHANFKMFDENNDEVELKHNEWFLILEKITDSINFI